MSDLNQIHREGEGDLERPLVTHCVQIFFPQGGVNRGESVYYAKSNKGMLLAGASLGTQKTLERPHISTSIWIHDDLTMTKTR